MRSKKRNLEYDKAYMKMAEAFSELSYAERAKVGSIIVSEYDQVVSQGFNGTPSGFDNCCENVLCNNVAKCPRGIVNKDPQLCKSCQYCELVTKPEVLHAEANAITKCAKNCISTKNGTIYVTLSPCIECSKLIIQSEIKRVVYRDIYRNCDGLNFLRKSGVIVEQLSK